MIRSQLLVFASLISLAACAHHSGVVVNGQTPNTTTSGAAIANNKSDQTVNLARDVRSLCGIDDANRAPKFDFDSSLLSSNDRDVLAQVAKCMASGPLTGKNIQLVGRADPRGEAEYNMNLGESRANAARAYLRQLGIDGARISDTSRGALDAQGHDEETWRLDRRVDISLAR